MNSLKLLSDHQLMAAIEKAKELSLEEEFIRLLSKELQARSMRMGNSFNS